MILYWNHKDDTLAGKGMIQRLAQEVVCLLALLVGKIQNQFENAIGEIQEQI